MKFAILVCGAPYSSQAAQSAVQFARSVLDEGHSLYRIFFYHDGVLNGSELLAPPQDESQLQNDWAELAAHTELVVCIASALRRGIVDEAEARRFEKPAHNLATHFTISGLGQLIDASLEADRLVTFHA